MPGTPIVTGATEPSGGLWFAIAPMLVFQQVGSRSELESALINVSIELTVCLPRHRFLGHGMAHGVPARLATTCHRAGFTVVTDTTHPLLRRNGSSEGAPKENPPD